MLVREKSTHGKERKNRNAEVRNIFIQKELKAFPRKTFQIYAKKTKVLRGTFDTLYVIFLLNVKVRDFILNNKGKVVNF